MWYTGAGEESHGDAPQNDCWGGENAGKTQGRSFLHYIQYCRVIKICNVGIFAEHCQFCLQSFRGKDFKHFWWFRYQFFICQFNYNIPLLLNQVNLKHSQAKKSYNYRININNIIQNALTGTLSIKHISMYR